MPQYQCFSAKKIYYVLRPKVHFLFHWLSGLIRGDLRTVLSCPVKFLLHLHSHTLLLAQFEMGVSKTKHVYKSYFYDKHQNLEVEMFLLLFKQFLQTYYASSLHVVNDTAEAVQRLQARQVEAFPHFIYCTGVWSDVVKLK